MEKHLRKFAKYYTNIPNLCYNTCSYLSHPRRFVSRLFLFFYNHATYTFHSISFSVCIFIYPPLIETFSYLFEPNLIINFLCYLILPKHLLVYQLTTTPDYSDRSLSVLLLCYPILPH